MNYVVRSDKGETFTSTEWGENNGKEIIYATYQDAEKAKEEIQLSFIDMKLKIIEVE